MIGCPSDVKEEVVIAREVIRNWSETNAELHKMVLLPLHWSTNSFPEMGAHPQKALDKQLVDRSDLLVCIFASKIGTATDTAESGNIEEIEKHIEKNKPVMLYFTKTIDISTTSPENLQKLSDFKFRMKDKALWWEYQDKNDFKDSFKQHLQEFLNANWLKNNLSDVTGNGKIMIMEGPSVELNEIELEMFCKWANSQDQTYIVVPDRTGVNIYLGTNNGYHFNRGKEEAEFKDYISRLLKLGYIEIKRVDKKGNNIYEITKTGYEFAQNQ